MVANQRAEVEEVTESLIDDMAAQAAGEVEFIENLAHPLPVHVISKIMGLPLKDGENLGEWSKNIGLTLFHYYDAEDRHQRTEESIREFTDYLREVVQRRRADPQDDLITYLNRSEADGETLTEDEVVATAVLLLFAGQETTTKLLANGVLELLRHPEQMEMLREDPSLAPQAVEEILRYQGTSKSLTRGVVKDFELRGKQIEAGDRILLNQAAANRDPRKFDDPETFDITRGSMEHLGFGHGTHHCLGAPLARLETRIAFPALVRAFPDMELATDEIEWTRSPLVRGPEELHIRL
jgi:cytochrome P450